MTGRYGFYLVLQGEGAVGDVGGQIRVVDGAEGQAVGPAAAEVRDVDILEEEDGGDAKTTSTINYLYVNYEGRGSDQACL